MSSKFMKSAFVGWTFTAGVYYPPDFDASKLMPVKALKPKGQQAMNIRMMFPFTMVCDSCKEYNYTGTKFTAKTEVIKGEEFLGLKVYRFYGRCRHCWSEFTFKTDPKNSDYTMESGGKRTYEAWKDADAMETQIKQEQEKDAAQDHMKALEQKAVDVQAEMQRLEDLDAIRTLNKRLGARDQSIQAALDYLFEKDSKVESEKEALSPNESDELASFQQAQHERRQKLLDDEVEAGSAVASTEGGEAKGGSSSSSSSSTATAARAAGSAILSAVAERASAQAAKAKPRFAVKVKRKAEADVGEEPADAKKFCGDSAKDAVGYVPAAETTAALADTKDKGGGVGLLGAYDSSDSS